MASLALRVLRRVWSHPGNRRHRLKGLVRAVGWQIYKRIARSPLVVDYPEGFSITCWPDSGCASNIFYGNLYFDLAEMNLVRRVLRAGDGFIDGGANIGVYSMLAASLVGETGRVIAFEPFPTHADRLRDDARRNGFDQIAVHVAALSDRSGVVPFVVTRDVSNRIQTRTDDARDTIPVRTTTLDETVGNLRRLCIGKLDLEGSEVAALRGAHRLLSQGNPVLWIIEWDPGLLGKRGHRPGELLNCMESNGYRMMRLSGDRFEPADLPLTPGNLVFVHEASVSGLEDRLRQRRTPAPPAWRIRRRSKPRRA